jgi:phosphate transport system protein
MSDKMPDQELQNISYDMLILGSMVEQSLVLSVMALKDHDMDKSRFVKEGDKRINKKRYELEGQIITAMATQSSITRDLRFLASSMIICTELERIGDYSKSIASANLLSGGISMPAPLAAAQKMGMKVGNMLHRAMIVFIDANAEAARKIIYEDDVVDGMYSQLYNVCMDQATEDPRNTDRMNYLLWAARDLERSADCVANICQRAIFVKTGFFEYAN